MVFVLKFDDDHYHACTIGISVVFAMYSMFDGWFYYFFIVVKYHVFDPAFIHFPMILTMVLKEYCLVCSA